MISTRPEAPGQQGPRTQGKSGGSAATAPLSAQALEQHQVPAGALSGVKTVCATVSVASSTTMTSVSYGLQSSSQKCRPQSTAPTYPPCACAGGGALGSVVADSLRRVYH